ncbi:hypothetical protein K402DRAFT_152979 [Aulographum hederae CBS 113979]|uniref:Extracellular membrane protein CFEM domain-containing protein n=1 Tax=Aulographum hederae CBS 113979 TaxID=1176131 RepID=A0A6G1GSN4_9PEZI|nr:hypothetical protein K402DRAFT_152979 [Aulographum hederae CBS 113979]
MPSRRIPSSALLALLSIHTTLIDAIALSSFSPSLTNLPGACNQAYNRNIAGCQANDFSGTSAVCSQTCINGLVDINRVINSACASVDVPETSLVGLFLLGEGIQVLCRVEVVTAAPSPTAIGSSTLIAPSIVSSSTGILFDTSASPTPTVPLAIEPSSTSILSNVVPSTASESTESEIPTTAPTQTSLGSSTTVATSASSTVDPQTSSTGSADESGGGGSPFDNFQGSASISAVHLNLVGIVCAVFLVLYS